MSDQEDQDSFDGEIKQVDEEQLDAILKDPLAKAALLKKMGLDDSEARGSQHPTPSTASWTNSDAWSPYPSPFWPGLFPPFLYGSAARQPMPMWMEGRGVQGWLEESEDEATAGPSAKRPRIQDEEEDMIDLLDDSEALEMVEFDPKVKPADTWFPRPISNFLHKHFNKALTEEERDPIRKYFPRPNSRTRGRIPTMEPRNHCTRYKICSWMSQDLLLAFGQIFSTRGPRCPRKMSYSLSRGL